MGTEQESTEKGQRVGQRNPSTPPGSASQQSSAAPSAARPSGDETRTVEVRHKAYGAADEASAGLDQIREILFGTVQHELERRLARTDGQLLARSHDLEQEARRRTDVLELHFKQEIEAIASQLERGLTDTKDGLRKAGTEQHDAVAAVEQRLAKLEEATAHGQRELRRQMLEQAKSFLDELQQLRRELIAMLQEELGLAERELVEELREPKPQAGH
jgi:hypothetical protein